MQQAPPVAIRITRPYQSEAEFLEGEGETVTKSSVMLVGASHRPQGVILRFEVVLASGQTLLRGEGRVTGFKERAFGDEAGLVLRFTRLDPRSKAFIDRATSGGAPVSTRAPESTPVVVAADPADPAPSQRVLPPSDNAAAVTPPAPPAPAEAAPSPPRSSAPSAPPPPVAAPPPPAPPAPPPAEAHAPPVAPRQEPSAARNREDLLGRLRSRHARMSPEQVSHILARLL
jgi:hypothetical protein